MGKTRPGLLIALISTIGLSCSQGPSNQIDYPQTAQVDQVDDYHGTEVRDPFRWLEDMNSAETRSWIEQQKAITDGYLQQLPEKERIADRLTELWNYEKFSSPSVVGNTYYYMYNDGLKNQSSLYRKRLGEDPELLIDPNTLSEDGTVSLAQYAVSPNETYIAYMIQRSGSDWREVFVYDVDARQTLDDHLKWVKFSSIAWTSSERGFYYTRYPEPKQGEELSSVVQSQSMYYHKAGSSQSEDQLVYQRKDKPKWFYGLRMGSENRYLVISISESTNPENRIYYRDIWSSSPVIRLLDNADANYEFIGNDGSTFYFKTTLNAPNGRVIAININDPRRSRWADVIEESEKVIESASIVNEHIVIEYLKDAQSQVKLFDLTGEELGDVALPGPGSITSLSGTFQSSDLYFGYTDFFRPNTIYRYEFRNGEVSPFQEPSLKFDPEEYTSEQVFVTSKDGTRLPMFIAYKRSTIEEASFKERYFLEKEGFYPTLLYSYGGFNISMTPGFNVRNLVWMEMGGIYAQPSLRGGGEYGETWHKAGMLGNKQNVFDDFIASAKYLIENEYTSPKRLAIHGGSNGGLLVGAVMTQRPDLFGAALPAVGVLDMLRYQYFTIGWAWAGEYGRSDNPAHFPFLYQYSPLHNVDALEYPATLITTSDHDDRVVPAHSYKFASELQRKQQGSAPILIRIETDAGHGAGVPTSKRIDLAADQLAFMKYNLK